MTALLDQRFCQVNPKHQKLVLSVTKVLLNFWKDKEKLEKKKREFKKLSKMRNTYKMELKIQMKLRVVKA
jgi:hypothetical protein